MACLGSKAIANRSNSQSKKHRKCRRTPSPKPTAAATPSPKPTVASEGSSYTVKKHKKGSRKNNSSPTEKMKGARKLKNSKPYDDSTEGGFQEERNYEIDASIHHGGAHNLHNSFHRKKLDPETIQYFTEISSLLENSSTDAEERVILCSNALDESRGKELQLCCDKVFSRLFENLILSCEKDQLCSFLSRCINIFPSMAIDQSGSHVAEAMLRSLALALQDCDAKGESHTIIEQVLTMICEKVAENPVDVMCNQYGSHVLRSLLCLCHGTLLESQDKFHSGNITSTLADRLSGLSSQLPKKKLDKTSLRAFPNLLKFVASKILEYSRDSVAVLRVDTFGSLVLQTILKLLVGDKEAVVGVITVLLGCSENNVMKEGKVLEDATVQNVLDLMMDPIGSHLMEVILEVAPDSLYMEILNRYFRHSLLEIATHESGNFVVQSLVSSSRHQGQVNMIWGEIGSKFTELLKARKPGVVASLIGACRRFQTHQRECCRALAHAVNSDSASPNYIVPHVLHLENFSSDTGRSKWQWPSGNKMSVLGCVMLQIIFNYPSDFIQQFCSSFASMEIDHILEAAKDPGGSRVIEAFLSSNAPLKHKHRVISKLRGHFGELAQRPSSSFTVSKCFLAADLALKEAIASELAYVQAELSRLKHGPHLLRICDVTRYSKGPEQWRSSQSSKQSTRQAFAEVFGSEGEAKREDDTIMVSCSEEATEIPKKKSKKSKRDRGMNNIIDEMDNTFLIKEDTSNLMNSVAQLGFPIHKGTKRKELNRQSETNENETGNHEIKAIGTKLSFPKRDLLKKSGKDVIEEIFSKKDEVNKPKKGKNRHESQNNSANAKSVQVGVDSSISNVLNILEQGLKKKKRKNKHGTDDPATSSAKKQKQGKQMVYM